MTQKVLFVCLGNICRSPIAEAVFQDLINKKGLSDKWEVDSAAIGNWHVGKQPDQRARTILKNHQVEYNGRARQIKQSDFNEFDYIFGMDEENMSDLSNAAPEGSKAKILMLGNFDPKGDKIIRDPYYDSDSEGFEKCFQQCLRSCEAFLKQF